MFALFFSLYMSMFVGRWTNYSLNDIIQDGRTAKTALVNVLNSLGTLATSIFGDNQMTNFGETFISNDFNFLYLVAFILALITSIGIVVVAFKGIKRIFTIFFQGVR